MTSSDKKGSDRDELESTAEFPPLAEDVREGGGAMPRSEGAKGSTAAEPAGDASTSGATPRDEDTDDVFNEALDDTADLSAAIAREDTSELPLLRALEEDPTTELPLIDATQEGGESGAPSSADGPKEASEPEVPDRGETSEVVSAATITRDERTKRVHRTVRVLVVLAIVAVCYGAGAWYYSSHFFPGTTVNGVDASNATTEEVASALDAQEQDYGLTVSGLGFELSLEASDVGYGVDGSAMAEAARAQENAASWPLALFQSHDLNVALTASYDDESLTQKVDDAVQDFNTSSMNANRAYIGYDYSTYEYKVMGSVSGTALSAQDVHDACAEAIASGQADATVTDDMMHDATLDDCLALQEVVDIANRDCNATISITVNGEEKWSLSSELRSWIRVSNAQIVVSQSGVRTWATYYLAPQVAYSDDSGSYTLDVGSMVTTLMDHLAVGDTSAIEAPMTKTSR